MLSNCLISTFRIFLRINLQGHQALDLKIIENQYNKINFTKPIVKHGQLSSKVRIQFNFDNFPNHFLENASSANFLINSPCAGRSFPKSRLKAVTMDPTNPKIYL